MNEVRPVRPVTAPIETRLRVPGSKSETIRALMMASLGRGRSTILRPLDSDDTRSARECLGTLGVGIEEHDELWTVSGIAGDFGSRSAQLDAGASGLTARCAIAMSTLVDGDVTISGRDRLPERPMGALVDALAQLGVTVTSNDGHLPVVVTGTGSLPGGRVVVDSTQSSQFVTALLVVAPLARERMTIAPSGLAGSSGYLAMTLRLMGAFGVDAEQQQGSWTVPNVGYEPASVSIEPDASAAVYPLAAAAITGGIVTVEGLGKSSLQPDLGAVAILEEMGCSIAITQELVSVDARDRRLRGVDADLSALPDGALAIAAVALFASGTSRLRGLGSLRFKESDRLAALATEIERLGAGATVEGDDLVITPGELRPARLETYGDHRIAMALALAGLAVPGVEVSNPGVVGKTWPGYWEMLEALAQGVA